MKINQFTWESISESSRKRLIWWLWMVTWLLLLGGLFERALYHGVVALSAAHALLFLALFRWRTAPMPVQVRLAYLLWVAVGTYVPWMVVLMYITTVGLAANLFVNYCPLARLLMTMPWNRSEPLTGDLLKRIFLTPPAAGRFTPPPGDT